ncbi:hypothetical protein CYY_007577 [Polysphondylium violaceum]|uniref:tRNA-uridine aminocarboxypropyltransferase 1 n=1 Tax=Polysphondylium violaceum TaxID=133409 RepID=A0A8J4PNH4_9MYCE|nr:hypothetical protein CYY_007577 [Polysphondylium violaceum]
MDGFDNLLGGEYLETEVTDAPVNDENNPTKQQHNHNLYDATQVLENIKSDESWLSELKLASFDHMSDLARANCSKCSKKRKYFCYDCCLPLGDPSKTPKLKLPLSVDVLHYPTELISKSTAIHSRVLARDDVEFKEFPNVPEYNAEETILLFPSEDSCFVKDIDCSKIKKVVFIESQWHNTKKILAHPNLKNVRCVKIDLQKTMFWRYQHHGENFLATIEAIYYFFKEYQQAISNGAYNGEYDNLLYYYTFFYNLIQSSYKHSNKDFKRKDNYIK